MRALPIAALLFLAGCPSKEPAASTASASASASASVSASAPAPVSASASASASEPAWLAAADRAPAPYGANARRTHAAASPFRDDVALDELFARVVAQPATAAGVRGAAKLLEDGAGTGTKGAWAGSGTSPSALMLHDGGVALLADLVLRACDASPKDAAIGKAVESIPIPPVYSSVLDRTAMERDRDALRVAGAGCGLKPNRPQGL